jgi:dephospho-CoA kinase
MIVIGVIGKNGSGKDELVDYLVRHCGLDKYSLGDIVRAIAQREGRSSDREDLHQVTQEYYQRFGRDYFAHRLIGKIEAEGAQEVGITGIRSPTDVDTLADYWREKFLLVRVQVDDPLVRFRRMRERDSARDPEHIEDFYQQEESEQAIFHIDQAIEKADMHIENNGSLEEYYQHIEDKIIHWFFPNQCQKNSSHEAA